MNEYSLEEDYTSKASSRKIKLSFTDAAISRVTHLFDAPPAVMVSGPGRSVPKVIMAPLRALGSPEKPVIQRTIAQEVSGVSASRSTDGPSSDAQDPVADFFEMTGAGEVTPTITDFKGANKREQQVRFALLCIWAHNVLTSVPAQRETITAAAKRVGLLDQHFPANIKRNANLIIVVDSGHRLNSAGEKRVQELVVELRDEAIKGFAYWNSSTRPSRRRSGGVNKGSQKIVELLAHAIEVEKLDIRSLTSPANQAVFAVWCLTRAIPEPLSAVDWKIAYAYLRQKFQNLPSASENAFRQAVTRTKLVARNSEKLFYLTKDGESIIGKWRAGDTASFAVTAES